METKNDILQTDQNPENPQGLIDGHENTSSREGTGMNEPLKSDNLDTPAESESNTGTGQSNMLVGALVCIGGILVTAITYSAVKETGGTYIIAWGAIVFGAIQFFRGLFQNAESKS
jgi:hypothetical protein